MSFEKIRFGSKNLKYLDVNFLYPFAASALNLVPGLVCNYRESLEEQALDLNNLFGFFYAKVKN
jgi:hypothetical protein